MNRFVRTLVFSGAALIAWPAGVGLAQTAPSDPEIEALREDLRKMQERLQKLEQKQPPAAPATPVAPEAAQPVPQPVIPAAQQPAQPPVAPRPGEREILLQRENITEVIGLPKPEIAGTRISGFFVGSANFNSRNQLVPEFAGGAPASSEPGSLDFRFDQFAIGAFRTFSPWLSAGASIEVERHSNRHSHITCVTGANCFERFGAETIETEIDLHRFAITGIAPLGNGLAISFGRFDTPYGYERHDAPLRLTATTSEVQRFGRPQSMTGFTFSYPFAPWLDATAWVVNRWENETTEDPLEDNNRDKSFGGRLGFTLFPAGQQLLNVGIGGWWGPEQDENNHSNRWIVDLDATWSPIPKLLLTGEFVYGGEQGVSMRERGQPFRTGPVNNANVNWLGLYALAHYDVLNWLGVSFRYGYFFDEHGARTGVKQDLHSITFAPVIHLSRLIPDLRPPGVTYARTRHPLDWVDIRVEYRHNFSNQRVFSDATPGTLIGNNEAHKESDQLTVQFVVNF